MSKVKKSEKILDSFFSNPYSKFRLIMDIEGISVNELKKKFSNPDFIREFVVYIDTKLWDLATISDICLCNIDFKDMVDKLICLYHDSIIDRRSGHQIMFEIMRNCMIEGCKSAIDEKTKNAENITLPYYLYDFTKVKDFNIKDNLFIVTELGRFAKELNK